MLVDDRDVETKGEFLQEKLIDFVVTGGIAAIESPKIIRELRRYGASVRVFMTANATRFVSPLVFEWASKNAVVTDLSGAAEHISHADAVIVAPATSNFISKIAMGICDSAATTLVQSALSRMPVNFAPAMHLSLAHNPIFEKNLKSLAALPKISILSPDSAEGKAKMMGYEEIAARVCHQVSESSLRDKTVVISLGPTRSYADDMRFLSNRSTGALGVEIADCLFRSGANIFCIAGPTQVSVPKYLDPIGVETNEQMRNAFQTIVESHSPEVGIFSAAVLDFEIANCALGKSTSKEHWSLDLRPSPKLIRQVPWPKNMLKVGFKLESRIMDDDLKNRAKRWAEDTECELLIANRLEDVEGDHRAFLFRRATQSFTEISGKKAIASSLRRALEESFRT